MVFFNEVYIDYMMLYNFQTDKVCVPSSLECIYSHILQRYPFKFSVVLKKNETKFH